MLRLRLALQGAHDAYEPNRHRLQAADDNDEMGPVEDGEAAELNAAVGEPQKGKCQPGPDVERHHAPRLGHDAAIVALHADGLPQRANVSRQECEDRRPVAAEWMTE